MKQNKSTPMRAINFIKISQYTIYLFLLFILLGATSLLIHGFSWGVDFAGGKQIRITFQKDLKVNRDSLEKVFTPLGIKANITQINNTPVLDEFFIYYPDQKIEGQKIINASLTKSFGNKWEIISESFVGPKIGKQFQRIALSSTIITLILLMIYIAFRFEFKFGVAALVSLIHDIVLVLCAISLLDISFNIPILAAVLTIVGYSLNDTIVIFDRMRSEKILLGENKTLRGYTHMINISITKSLTRTFLTAGTTLMSLSILYFVGGVELKPMSLILILGIIIGTLSSNIIAPPILYLWYKSELKKA